MYSLYHSLLAQHPRQLMPVPCAGSTIAQLHRYFEDVVLENNLGALVVESLPMSAERPARDIARIQELRKAARNLFLWVSPQDAMASMVLSRGKENTKSVVFEQTDEGSNSERFVVIADARFSALLASVHNADEEDTSRDLVIWTFEPDVVYSALEYLMKPSDRRAFVSLTSFCECSARVDAESYFAAIDFGSNDKTRAAVTGAGRTRNCGQPARNRNQKLARAG